MPLYKLESISENIHLAVWKIEEELPALIQTVLLTDQDKQLFKEITHHEKKLEFLAGRQLIHTVTKQLDILHGGVLRNMYGKPELMDSIYQVSLSHTADFVSLLIGKESNVGLDIEKPQEKMRRIAPRLFNEYELSVCNNELEKISKMWSSKEVLFKLYMKGGIDFKENLFIYDVNEDFSNCMGRVKKGNKEFIYPISFQKLQDYFICYNLYDPN